MSLLEPAEQAELDLAREPEAVAAGGLVFRGFPIPDRSVPISRQAAAELVDEIADALGSGKTVALHCRQGIGRSAVMAAAQLIAGGLTPDAAIETIRRSRGLDVPETPVQQKWIADFATWRARRRAIAPRHAAS